MVINERFVFTIVTVAITAKRTLDKFFKLTPESTECVFIYKPSPLKNPAYADGRRIPINRKFQVLLDSEESDGKRFGEVLDKHIGQGRLGAIN